jgi:hypothetical protein
MHARERSKKICRNAYKYVEFLGCIIIIVQSEVASDVHLFIYFSTRGRALPK